MSATYPIAIIEADSIFREGLMRVLRRHPLKVVGGWSSFEEAVREKLGTISVILVSLFELGMLEPQSVEMLRESYPSARIALLVEKYNDSVATSAAAERLDGVLLRSSTPANLVKALELIALGDAVFPKPTFLDATGHHRPPDGATAGSEALEKLSARERQVIDGLAKGLPNKVIARYLDITDATVKVHVKSILRKTGASNRTEAALWARDVGIDPD